VPQIRPEIYVVLLTCTVASLRAFAWIYALTSGGPGTATQVPSFYSYISFFTNLDVGYGSAIATVLTLIIIVVSAVFLWTRRRHQAMADLAWPVLCGTAGGACRPT